MRISLRRATTTVAAAVLAIGASTSPAQASTVSPDSYSGCTAGSSSGNTLTCLAVTNTGLKVINMTAEAGVKFAPRRLRVCLHGPNGTIGCTPSTTTYKLVGLQGNITFKWNPNPTVHQAAGDYCANTFRDNGDGTNTEIGHICNTLHA